MSRLLVPALVALAAWWVGTGMVLLLDRLPRRTFRWTLAGGGLVFVAALAGLALTSRSPTPGAAYLGFACGLLAWAFIEITFLTGWITGTRRHACPATCAGWRHFLHGIEAILHHELAIVAAALAVTAAGWGGPNQVGTWTFLILWIMRQSAKLNLFLGVPNLGAEFLPEHLRYLTAFFRRRPMNLLFPLSVTGATLAAALLLNRAFAAAAGSFEATGYGLLGSLMALALLEHWLLVLPLRAEALWQFGLGSRREPAARPAPEPGDRVLFHPAPAAAVKAVWGSPPQALRGP